MNLGPIGNTTSIKTIQHFREELAESRKSGIKKCAAYLSMLLSVATVLAQEGGSSARADKFNHVQWSLTFDRASAAPGGAVLARLEAMVDPDWHMYSLTTPPGPIPTVISANHRAAIEEFTVYEPPPVRRFDPVEVHQQIVAKGIWMRATGEDCRLMRRSS